MMHRLTLITPDSPTAHGNVYMSIALKEAFDEKAQLIKERKFMGRIGRPVIVVGGVTQAFEADKLVPITEASHTVTSLERENNAYHCTIEVLDTPEGKKLKDLIAGPGIELKMAGSTEEMNEVGPYRYIKKFKLASINAVPIEIPAAPVLQPPPPPSDV